jgi:WD40 repeat protein
MLSSELGEAMATVVSSKPAIPSSKQSRSNHFRNRFLFATRLVAALFLLCGMLVLMPDPDSEHPAINGPPDHQATEPNPANTSLKIDLPENAIARLGSMNFRAWHTSGMLAFSPDGNLLASASGNPAGLDIWDAKTGQRLRSFAVPFNGFPASRLGFSGDGKQLFMTGSGFCLLDALTGTKKKEFPSLGGFSSCFAFSPDGRAVAKVSDTTKHDAVKGSGTLALWDLTEERETFLDVGGAPVYLVAFSPDSKTLATDGPGQEVCLWEVATGHKLQSWERKAGRMDAMGFTPNGKILACSTYAGSKIGFWSVETGKLLYYLPDEADAMYTNIHFSPDSKLVATPGDGGSLVLWDVETGKEVRRWYPHADSVTALAFSPDGKVLASTGFRDFGIRRWDVATGKEISRLTGHTGRISTFAFTPNGKTLFSLSDGDFRVCQWDLATGSFMPVLFDGPLLPRPQNRGHNWWLASDLSPDGKTVAFMSQFYEEGKDYKYVIQLVDTKTCTESGSPLDCNDQTRWIKFSPDGKLLVSNQKDGIPLWDVASRKQIQHISKHWYPAFAADSTILAANSFDPVRGVIDFWEIGSGKKARHWQDPGLDELDRHLFSPDGAHLALWSHFGDSVQIRSLATGKVIRSLEKEHAFDERSGLGKRSSVMADPVFSRTGRILATVMHDGRITLWDMLSGQEIRRINTGQGSLTTAAFAPGDRILVTGASDSSILLWDLTGFHKSGKLAPPEMTAARLAAYWSDLADDAVKAEQAHWAIALSPGDTVAFLKKKLLAIHDPKQIAEWIGDLNSDSFAVRNRATLALEEVGPAATETIKKALEGNITLEFRRRAEGLLAKYERHATRDLRVVDVLEHMATAESRELLEILTNAPTRREVATAAALALKRAR